MVLDTTQPLTLTTLFEAGLRPTNISGMEQDKCEVLHRELELVTLNGVRLRIEADQAEFTIAADGSITEIHAEGRNVPLAAALPEAERLFNLLGGSPTDLRTRVAQAQTARSFEPLREVGLGTVPGLEPTLGVGFVPGDFVRADPHTLYVHLGLSMTWPSKGWHRPVRSETIRPPAGYEQFSMAPVPRRSR